MTMNELVDNEVARPRFQAELVMLFAVFTMALAALGSYGVISQNVRARIPELGLRRALGAGSADLLGLVLRQGMMAPLVGLVLGLGVGALLMGRVLSTVLYGVSPREPIVFIVVGVTLAFTSLCACLLPARDAMRIEPLTALRLD